MVRTASKGVEGDLIFPSAVDGAGLEAPASEPGERFDSTGTPQVPEAFPERTKRRYRRRKKTREAENSKASSGKTKKPADEGEALPPYNPLAFDLLLMGCFAFAQNQLGPKWIPTENEALAIRQSFHAVGEKRMPSFLLKLQPELALIGSVGEYVLSRVMADALSGFFSGKIEPDENSAGNPGANGNGQESVSSAPDSGI